MPYYRLIEETNTEIHVDSRGMEIPGVECVYIIVPNPKPNTYYFDNYTVIFEDGRTIKTINARHINKSTKHILTKSKCLTSDS